MTAKEDAPAATVPFTDNLFAIEGFATAARGFLNHQGNIHITFTAPRVNYTTSNGKGVVHEVTVARLVMPAGGAHSLAVGLFNFLKEQGYKFDEPQSPSGKLQ